MRSFNVKTRWAAGARFLAVVVAAACFRGAGLWHGLDQDLVFHPDAPKQVQRLECYLRGDYTVRTGSRFIDGYPYGLNRVDEAILRVWLCAADRGASWVSGRADAVRPPPIPPDRASLYRAGRVLRLLYGVLAALLVQAAARRWGAGPGAAMAGALLYAVSPLAVTVAHSVTGDVGVDLFVAAALWAAAFQADTGRAVGWLAFGAACGAGFACKFQGVLAAWMALPAVGMGLFGGRDARRRTLAAVLLAAAGCLAAVLLLNPALATDTSRAWRDMRTNFAFIRDYGVPPDRLAWPFSRKVAWGLVHNVPFVAGCLGWGLTLFSLAASVRLAQAAARRAVAPSDVLARRSRWMLGVATFPWAAFLLAAALKLEIQPFHFSFLVPPMALAVALVLSRVPVPPLASLRRPAAAAGTVLAAAVLAASVRGTVREMFFWRRPDIKGLAARHAEAVFGDSDWGTDRRGSRRWFKRYYAEPATLPCFRNPESRLGAPPGAWTAGQTLLPVPPVPMPADPAGDGWIFLDGPVFPRSDRMFTVPASGRGFRASVPAADGSPLHVRTLPGAGVWTERILVFPEPPPGLLVGLRTGRLPARCEVSTSLAGSAAPRLLPPESQTVLELPRPAPVYACPADSAAGRPAVWACRLRVRAQLGPVWVSVLAAPGEEELFRLHGPTLPGAPASAGPVDPSGDVAAQLDLLRYLDSGTPCPLPVGSPSGALPPPVPGAGPGLASGPYRFRARVRTPAPARLALLLSDRNGSDAPDTLPSASFSLDAGETDIDWSFRKPFAPYGATLRAAADIPGCTILSWTLKPDPGAPSAAAVPAAVPVFPGGMSPEDVPATPLGTDYARTATLLDIRIPGTWHAGDTVPYTVRVRLEPRIPHRTFADLAVFLHLVDARGNLAATLDFPLADASFEGAPVRWKLGTPSLPPGTYTLRAGLFDVPARARKLRYVRSSLPSPDRHRRFVPVKTVTVLPDPPGADRP